MCLKKILIVEDQRVVAVSLEAVFSTIPNVECCWAQDGTEGLKKIKENTWDLVVSDWEMPNLDGVEMTRQLRLEGNQIPVVLCSGKSDLISTAEIFSLNFSDIWSKLFQIERVVSSVSNILKNIKEIN